MRESKTRLQSIAYGISGFEKDQEFDDPWPLHITLVPPFSDARQRVLLRELNGFAQRRLPLETKLGEWVLFGPQNDVPAALVEPARDLRTLHTDLMACATVAGGTMVDTDYIGYKYNAHISNRDGLELPETYVIDSFALITQLAPEHYRVQEVFEVS